MGVYAIGFLAVPAAELGRLYRRHQMQVPATERQYACPCLELRRALPCKSVFTSSLHSQLNKPTMHPSQQRMMKTSQSERRGPNRVRALTSTHFERRSKLSAESGCLQAECQGGSQFGREGSLEKNTEEVYLRRLDSSIQRGLLSPDLHLSRPLRLALLPAAPQAEICHSKVSEQDICNVRCSYLSAMS